VAGWGERPDWVLRRGVKSADEQGRAGSEKRQKSPTAIVTDRLKKKKKKNSKRKKRGFGVNSKAHHSRKGRSSGNVRTGVHGIGRREGERSLTQKMNYGKEGGRGRGFG